MVKHIIFFTLKDEADKDAVIDAAQKALLPLVGIIPGLTKMEVTKCFVGPDFVLYSELESKEALRLYADHPPMWRPRAISSPGLQSVWLRTTKYKEKEYESNCYGGRSGPGGHYCRRLRQAGRV